MTYTCVGPPHSVQYCIGYMEGGGRRRDSGRFGPTRAASAHSTLAVRSSVKLFYPPPSGGLAVRRHCAAAGRCGRTLSGRPRQRHKPECSTCPLFRFLFCLETISELTTCRFPLSSAALPSACPSAGSSVGHMRTQTHACPSARGAAPSFCRPISGGAGGAQAVAGRGRTDAAPACRRRHRRRHACLAAFPHETPRTPRSAQGAQPTTLVAIKKKAPLDLINAPKSARFWRHTQVGTAARRRAGPLVRTATADRGQD